MIAWSKLARALDLRQFSFAGRGTLDCASLPNFASARAPKAAGETPGQSVSPVVPRCMVLLGEAAPLASMGQLGAGQRVRCSSECLSIQPHLGRATGPATSVPGGCSGEALACELHDAGRWAIRLKQCRPPDDSLGASDTSRRIAVPGHPHG